MSFSDGSLGNRYLTAKINYHRFAFRGCPSGPSWAPLGTHSTVGAQPECDLSILGWTADENLVAFKRPKWLGMSAARCASENADLRCNNKNSHVRFAPT